MIQTQRPDQYRGRREVESKTLSHHVVYIHTPNLNTKFKGSGSRLQSQNVRMAKINGMY